jgi:hypothetical protein
VDGVDAFNVWATNKGKINQLKANNNRHL